MTAMPSESNIRDAIDALASQSAKFQVVAESIMKIKFGGVYANLIPQGRNAKLQPTVGYPDAYATDTSGKYYLVEATLGDWRKHIDNEDIPGITQLTQVHGAEVAEFALFCTSSSELLIKQDRKNRKVEKKSVDAYKDDLARLGVPAGRIHFFFLDQIVKELRQPVYARVLADLGLDIDIAPFCSITQRLYPPDTGPGFDEFARGGVVANDLIGTMRSALQPGSRMLVEGGSGLGKTTLATAFAFDWRKQEREAYYIDLAAFDDPAAIVHLIVQRIKLYASRTHLFILDNCHRLAPDLLSQVLDTHVEKGDRPTILALTRNLAEHTAEALRIKHGLKRLRLSLRDEDLCALYRLLARRFSQSDDYAMPAPAELRQWQALHADLVTFSLALNRAKNSLRAGLVPVLAKDDAINYLRERYVCGLPGKELEMLAAIALCARYDVPASETGLGGVPAESCKRGLVFERTAKNGTRRYALVHVKIGEILLTCLGVDESKVWQDLIRRDPFQACFIAQRLLHRGSEATEATAYPEDPQAAAEASAMATATATAKAKEILEQVGASAWQFSSLFSPGYSGVIASLYRQVGLEATFKATLNREISRYISEQQGFLVGLPSFLDFTKAAGFSAEATHVWSELLQAANDGRLETAARLAQVATVHNMLVLASEREPQVVEAIRASFSTKPVAAAIAPSFGKLEPKLAEQVLQDFARWTPALYHSLLDELPKGERLASLRERFAFARAPGEVRHWLLRHELLRLLADDPALLLPRTWLHERGTLVLGLLLAELEHLRPVYEGPVRILIASWVDEPIGKMPPSAAAIRLRLMLCMADQGQAPAVEAAIRKTKDEVLAACMQSQTPFQLGVMLIGATGVFGSAKGFARIKGIVLDVTKERISRAAARCTAKPPTTFDLACHIAVAHLAGADRQADWLQLALATLRQALARQTVAPRDFTRDRRTSTLAQSYLDEVANLLHANGAGAPTTA